MTTSRNALSINTSVDAALIEQLHDAIDRSGALLSGHFALKRGVHMATALRFRAVGRDLDALTLIARELAALPKWSWEGAKVFSPESAGFFLGHAIAAEKAVEHAVAQTDVRRLPTGELIAGDIVAGDRIVLVNDVGSTGKSLDPMLELVQSRGASVIGALIFAVVDAKSFQANCYDKGLAAHYLALARWNPVEPGERCPGCRERLPLVPIVELS